MRVLAQPSLAPILLGLALLSLALADESSSSSFSSYYYYNPSNLFYGFPSSSSSLGPFNTTTILSYPVYAHSPTLTFSGRNVSSANFSSSEIHDWSIVAQLRLDVPVSAFILGLDKGDVFDKDAYAVDVTAISISAGHDGEGAGNVFGSPIAEAAACVVVWVSGLTEAALEDTRDTTVDEGEVLGIGQECREELQLAMEEDFADGRCAAPSLPDSCAEFFAEEAVVETRLIQSSSMASAFNGTVSPIFMYAGDQQHSGNETEVKRGMENVWLLGVTWKSGDDVESGSSSLYGLQMKKKGAEDAATGLEVPKWLVGLVGMVALMLVA